VTAPKPTEPRCLACSAAALDAGDLLQMVVEDSSVERSSRAHHLVSGMDTERLWRALLFEAALAAGLADGFANAIGLPTAEVVQIVLSEITGVHHDH
jgi:hypothetical protein